VHQWFFKLLDDITRREKVKGKVKQQAQPQGKSEYLQVKTYLRYHNRILEKLLNILNIVFEASHIAILTLVGYNKQIHTM